MPTTGTASHQRNTLLPIPSLSQILGTHRPFVISLLCLGILTGCGDLGLGLDDEEENRCAGDMAKVSGSWTLTGSGSRTSCGQESLNTSEVEFGSVPLQIAQVNNNLTLRETVPVPGGSFTFSNGVVNGSCVSFETRETGAMGTQHYTWEGAVESSGVITGSVRGDGPGSCNVAGNFRIDVR